MKDYPQVRGTLRLGNQGPTNPGETIQRSHLLSRKGKLPLISSSGGNKNGKTKDFQGPNRASCWSSSSKTYPRPVLFSAPGLEDLRNNLEAKLSSRGGRPGVANWIVVRKTRYSAKTWHNLKLLAGQWSRGDASISPARVAAELVEGAVRSIRP